MENWELEEGISSLSGSSDFCMLGSFIIMPSVQNRKNIKVLLFYCNFENNRNTESWVLSEVWKGNYISGISDYPLADSAVAMW